MGINVSALRMPAVVFVLVVWISDPALAGPFTEAGYDPASMSAWATEVDEFARGPLDIATPSLGVATFGVSDDTLGPATGDSFDVFSLGDGGHITLFFASGIGDGPGDDFAVYENGFFIIGGLFAEFAFVEVSTDGISFARFDSTSLQTTPVSGGSVVDPTDYDNLAGKHPLASGTGFDLEELADHPLVLSGAIDLFNIQFVRMTDVIGDGSTLDGIDNPVFDPYPTAFSSGGFDLEAVGVLHVPEPSSLGMLLAGVGCLQVLKHRRDRA